MANSNIPAIDNLLTGGPAIKPGNAPDPDAVGAIQELLRGHGYKTPGLRVPGYKKFGTRTKAAVKDFRLANGLPGGVEVDQATLRKLIDVPATNPIVSQPYLTLVLNFDYTGYAKLVSLVAIVEGAGKFAALCFNSDQAGLSVGIIQWAQKPRRLAELVEKWNAIAAGKKALRPLLGFDVADDAGFNALVAHLKKNRGGTHKGDASNKAGETTDPNFDLIREPWKTRFKNACKNRVLQTIQVEAAIAAFTASHTNIKNNMPKVHSELGVAFTIDLANQFGDGGAKKIYVAADAQTPSGTEKQLLEKMRDESVARLKSLFPKQPAIAAAGADRRNFFLNESGLSSTGVFNP